MISSEVLDRIKRRLGAWEANDPTAIAKDFGPGGVMPRQDLVALVGRRTQAWNDHDPDAVSACYAANGVWRDLRRDAPARGRGAIRDATHARGRRGISRVLPCLPGRSVARLANAM